MLFHHSSDFINILSYFPNSIWLGCSFLYDFLYDSKGNKHWKCHTHKALFCWVETKINIFWKLSYKGKRTKLKLQRWIELRMQFCKFLNKWKEIRQQKWEILPPLELGYFPTCVFPCSRKLLLSKLPKSLELKTSDRNVEGNWGPKSH